MTAAVVIVLLGVGAACRSGDDQKLPAKGSAATPAQTPVAFARLDPAAFAERMQNKDAMVINVHVPYEGEIDQTDAFIPYDRIVGDPRLPKDKNSEILLYCRSGRMSEQAAAALIQAGYTNVADLKGGMNGWEAAARPLIRNPTRAS